MSFLSLTPDEREAMLAAIGVASIEELFRDIPAGVRLGRPLAVPPALAEADALLDVDAYKQVLADS